VKKNCLQLKNVKKSYKFKDDFIPSVAKYDSLNLRIRSRIQIWIHIVDIVMGPAYYNILKYQRSQQGGSPAFRARHSVWLRESFL
jgi:hypothetical protein